LCVCDERFRIDLKVSFAQCVGEVAVDLDNPVVFQCLLANNCAFVC